MTFVLYDIQVVDLNVVAVILQILHNLMTFVLYDIQFVVDLNVVVALLKTSA